IDRFNEKPQLRHPDDDIWLAMNLLQDTPNDNLAYPVMRFVASMQPKITALLVGDSFYFNWQNDKILLNTFAESDFWYYNKNVYNQAGGATGTVASLDFGEQIMKQDLIMMMITDRFNHCFMWNFDEQLYDYFYPGPKNAREVYANDIRTSNEYFLRMYKEAKATGMPFQDRLKTEVEFKMYLDYLKDPKQFTNKEDVILMLMMSIKGTPDWYEKIKTKAKERNMSVEEMLRLDAEWVYNERQKKGS
ncbi:MAG: hypothetical protein Q8T08_14905, partial [Ignavibacteria bacterium]|nr:hypothetical protein [Ignavibacteria bacterium]